MPAQAPAHNSELSLKRSPDLVMVMDTPKGRGIFAINHIRARSIIERCPILVLPSRDLSAIKTTILNHYTYNWPTKDPHTRKMTQTQAMALGLGSLFNHSALDHNVSWSKDVDAQCITYIALRDIGPGEELCINYGRLWFADVDIDVEGKRDSDGEWLANIEI